MTVLVDRGLHGFVKTGARRTSVANLGDVVQTQTTGRNSPRETDAHVVDRKDSAVVFEIKNERTINGSLHPATVVVGGVVVSDCRVITAHRHIECVGNRIIKTQTLEIETNT